MMDSLPRRLRRHGTAADVKLLIEAEFASLKHHDNKALLMQIYYIFQLANTRAGRELVRAIPGFARHIVNTWTANYQTLKRSRYLDLDHLAPLYGLACDTLDNALAQNPTVFNS